jgi:hypothetical protein
MPENVAMPQLNGLTRNAIEWCGEEGFRSVLRTGNPEVWADWTFPFENSIMGLYGNFLFIVVAVAAKIMEKPQVFSRRKSVIRPGLISCRARLCS